MEALRVGMIGLGTVGSGVARLLIDHEGEIAARAGGPLRLHKVAVRDPSRARSLLLPPGVVTGDAMAVARDPDVDVLVEVAGGVEPARAWACTALSRGADVVTANKQLLAAHGSELRALAAKHRCGLHVEAAVAGAVPIVRAVEHALAGDKVRGLYGIVNGTTNYILSRMTREGLDFADALHAARTLGYAEADPTDDVSGADAAAKLAVLVAVAFRADVTADEVYCEGIEGVTAGDVAAANELGFVIKLLAVARQTDGGLDLRVHPALVAKSHPLAAVHDAFNAVFVDAEAAGDLMFYGRGAGGMPTASAVLANLIDAAQDLRRGVAGRIEAPVRKAPLLPIGAVASRFLFTLWVADQPGVLGAVTTRLGVHGVSVESMFQKGRRHAPVDLVFLTHAAPEDTLRAALADLAGVPAVQRVAQVLRVAEFGGAR